MSSNIEKKLLASLDIAPKRGASRQDHLATLVLAIGKLSDAEWDKLDSESQDWFNKCADAKNAKKKELPEFSDYEEAEKEEEEKPARRRSKAADEERLTKVGDTATVLTKRGKSIKGKVIELDSKIIVIDDGKEEHEFDMERVASVTVAHGDSDDEPAGAPELKVGDEATATNKRGKTVTGKIIEMDDEMLVIDDGKEEHEFPRDRLESLVPAGGKAAKTKPAKEEEPEPSSRRRGAAKEEDEKPAGRTRASNEGGVSIGAEIRSLILDDLEATEEEIGKALKKKGLEFKDNTLTLNYKENHKMIAELKKRKMLK